MSISTWRSRTSAKGPESDSFEIQARAAFRDRYPNLTLGLIEYGDQLHEESPLSLTIRGKNGRIQVRLKDESSGEYAYFNAIELVAVLDELEAALANDVIHWLQDKPSGKRKS